MPYTKSAYTAMFSATLVFLAISSLPLALGTTYSTYAANSAIARGQGNGLRSNGTPTASYEHGEFQSGLKLLYERTGNRSYYEYIVEAVDRLVSENGTVGGDYPY